MIQTWSTFVPQFLEILCCCHFSHSPPPRTNVRPLSVISHLLTGAIVKTFLVSPVSSYNVMTDWCLSVTVRTKAFDKKIIFSGQVVKMTCSQFKNPSLEFDLLLNHLFVGLSPLSVPLSCWLLNLLLHWFGCEQLLSVFF